MDSTPKAPRVPPSQNSLAVAASRRRFVGALAAAPVALLPAPCITTAALAQHWEINRRALLAVEASEDEDANEHLWAQINRTEQAILDQPAKALDDVIAKLKVALLHMGSDRWVEGALVHDDHATLFLRADELDVTERLIVNAISDLKSMAGEGRHG